jgi:MOSC domain-containing protein
VSLVSTATIRDWDPRRFRSNVLLDGEGEDDLVGIAVQLGDSRLDIGKQIDRCVMITRPQPGGIERDLDVLRTVARERGNNLAVGALVAHPGEVRVGDALTTL